MFFAEQDIVLPKLKPATDMLGAVETSASAVN